MPHVIVKCWPGPSEEQKRRLAERILEDIASTFGSSANSISVAIEEVQPGDWLDTVYRPEIEPQMEKLYKKPGYGPSDL
jgi:4-oxalocrotonate tautomerase